MDERQERASEPPVITAFHAVLFDLDGVLVPTAELHRAAWKQTFDEFLGSYAEGAAARPFTNSDYRLYVDGRPRLDGVRSFLASRGIRLAEEAGDDGGDVPSVSELAEQKNRRFRARLEAGAVGAFPDALALLAWLGGRSQRLAVVSASHSCRDILSAAGIVARFETVVDGQAADTEHLVGKPAPDTFLAAARRLGLPPGRCVVVEDAIAGVEAGRAGAFGLVVGVDRTGGGNLRAHGADLVVHSLDELIRDPAPGA